MKSGLYEFYTSSSKFNINRRLNLRLHQFDHDDNDDDNNDLQPLKMSQFIRPMILIYGLFGVATLVFTAEFVVQKWNKNKLFMCLKKGKVTPILPSTSLRQAWTRYECPFCRTDSQPFTGSIRRQSAIF